MIGFTIIEATDEIAVLYQMVDEPKISFARPLTSWLELVARDDGREVLRFRMHIT